MHIRRTLYYATFLITVVLFSLKIFNRHTATVTNLVTEKIENSFVTIAYTEQVTIIDKKQMMHNNCSNFSSLTQSTLPPGVPLFIWPSEEKATLHRLSNDTIHVATVCCGSHDDYLVAFFKSLLVFSLNKRVTLYIIVEHVDNVLPLRTYFNSSTRAISHELVYEVYANSYTTEETKSWKFQFRPCASQKLLLPYALAHVKRVISLDLDTIILRPIEDIWSIFDSFNEHHIAALVGEEEEAGLKGYDSWAQHPFPPPAGLNVGVMLMDLSRMRRISWFCLLSTINNLFKTQILYFDQDIVNIYFFFHPEALITPPCSFNYRTDHCQRRTCSDVIKNGVGILHGNRNVFRRGDEPVFKSLHSIFLNEKITQNRTDLLKKMQGVVSSLQNSSCTALDVYSIGFSRTVT